MSKKSIAFSFLIVAVLAAGMASLLYEVLWVRQLGLSLGSTAVATSVMLSAFLGGLALGSSYIGRKADSLKSPVKVLALVEAGAAALGLLSIPALTWAGHAYVFLATAWGVTGVWATVLRALFSLVVMLLPAILFGMTFPLATTLGGRLISAQTSAGIISATSSFGSAIGALLCGLWLEPTFGIFTSACVGAGFNVLAAALVGGLSLLFFQSKHTNR
jgi:spermidine synthase